MRCPKCGNFGTLFGSTPQRRSYECKQCGHTFSEPVRRPYVPPAVRRLRNEIRYRIVSRPGSPKPDTVS
jgi:transposase-like protein